MNTDAEQQAKHADRWKQRMKLAGGEHVRDCVFRLNGITYDLSAADPKKLPLIIQNKFFVIEDDPSAQ